MRPRKLGSHIITLFETASAVRTQTNTDLLTATWTTRAAVFLQLSYRHRRFFVNETRCYKKKKKTIATLAHRRGGCSRVINVPRYMEFVKLTNKWRECTSHNVYAMYSVHSELFLPVYFHKFIGNLSFQ